MCVCVNMVCTCVLCEIHRGVEHKINTEYPQASYTVYTRFHKNYYNIPYTVLSRY